MTRIFRVVFLIFLVILLHELGHTVTALLFGIQVDRFSFGWGPGWSIPGIPFVNELHFGILPLGGYVVVDGTSLSNASIFAKLLFYLAGIFVNASSAFILLLGSRPDRWELFKETCLRLVGGPKLICPEETIRQMRWWKIFSPVGIFEILKDTTHSTKESFIWLSLLLAEVNLIPLAFFDGGRAVYVILGSIPQKVFVFLAMVLLLLVYLLLSGWANKKLDDDKDENEHATVKEDSDQDYAEAERMRDDFVLRHKLELTDEEDEIVFEIFNNLSRNRKISKTSEIPVITAVANQQLNTYLRSINKLPST